MKRRPTCYVIAGPNGAGKTTFAMEFLPGIAGCRDFINADLIARGLSPLNVEAAAIDAGRLFLRQVHAQIGAGRDFAFETTLSGLGYIKLMRELRNRGYAIRFYYLWIPSVQLTLKRIAERVKRGGHDIPSDVAVRRYRKGVVNLFRHYLGLTDYCAIFDNSSTAPLLVYEQADGYQRIIVEETFRRIEQQAEGVP